MELPSKADEIIGEVAVSGVIVGDVERDEEFCWAGKDADAAAADDDEEGALPESAPDMGISFVEAMEKLQGVDMLKPLRF